MAETPGDTRWIAQHLGDVAGEANERDQSELGDGGRAGGARRLHVSAGASHAEQAADGPAQVEHGGPEGSGHSPWIAACTPDERKPKKVGGVPDGMAARP